MMIAENLDWVFAVVGWTLAAGGLLAAAWVIRGDRARGRRRCPKCWYDMQGTAGLVCPECGRDARSERRLHKTRRRWRRAAMPIGLLALAVAVHQAPGLVRGGWKGAVPSTWLVMMPQDVGAWLAEYQGEQVANDDYPLRSELVKRVKEYRLAGWQTRWLIGRIESELRRRGTYGVNAESRAAAEWLDKPLPEIELKERSVGGIVAALEEAGAPVKADWASLVTEQVRPATPVAWAGHIERGTTLRQVLSTMFERLRPGTGWAWVGWRLDAGRIVVAGTRTRLVGARTVVYPVGDFGRMSVLISAPGGSGGLSSPASRVVDDSDFLRVADLFESLIDPQEWADNGGDAGWIRGLGTNFVVTATESMHLQIEELLGALRSPDRVVAAPILGAVVYDVDDLVRPVPAPADVDRARDSARERIEILGNEMVRTVSSESWIDNGGEAGSWRSWGSKLIVRAPADVRVGVARFLEDVRTGRIQVAKETPTTATEPPPTRELHGDG